MIVKVKKVDPRAEIPKYAHLSDACFDLRVLCDAKNKPRRYDAKSDSFVDLIPADGGIVIPAGETYIFNTGLAFEIPDGFAMKVYPRSSLGVKRGLCFGCSGIIDAGYRGAVSISLANRGKSDAFVRDFDRVAQAEISRVDRVEFEVVEKLGPGDRGENGMGSSGN